MNRTLYKAPQTVTTDINVKFEGTSVAQDTYKQWKLPPRYQRHRAEYTPSSAGFDATTNYNSTYQPKTAGRIIKIAFVLMCRTIYSSNPYLCSKSCKV